MRYFILEWIRRSSNILLLFCFICPFKLDLPVHGKDVVAPAAKNTLGIEPSVRIEALCSLYTKYEVCHTSVTPSSVSANFPTEYLQFNPDNLMSITIYDSRRREPNYALGLASTVILGPYGLPAFLLQRRVGDVDFGFKYRDGSKSRTAFIRFKNNRSIKTFGEAIKPFLHKLSDSNYLSR